MFTRRRSSAHRSRARVSQRRRVTRCLEIEHLEERIALSWTPVASLPTGRANLAAATGPDGKIYAIAGIDSATYRATSEVDAYDPAAKTWTVVASLPTARSDLAAATGPDGKIYAIGGLLSFNGVSSIATSEVDAYNPAMNTWTAVASLPTARGDLAAATGPDGRIYAIGGWLNGGVLTSEVDAYDPATNTWTAVASLPTARYILAAATGPDGKIYAIGGLGNAIINEVDAYDPATNTWTAVASLPTNRYTFAAATGPDGKIYAMGGSVGGVWTSEVDAYDPATNAWTAVASLPTARSDLAAATDPDGKIYAIGGTNGTGITSEVDAYTATASTGLAVDPASGTYGGTTTLTATLTAGGVGVPNQTVAFTLNGQPFSGNTAVTDSSGVATLSNVSLAGINAGTYPNAIGASFAGDTNYLSSSGTGTLTVNLLAVQVDQVYNPPQILEYDYISQIVDTSQTFTVGVSGTLAHVDMRVGRHDDTVTDPLLFDVRTTSGGIPSTPNSGGDILASVSIPASTIPTIGTADPAFFSVDLTPFTVPVTAGEVLAIVLRSNAPSNGSYVWVGTGGPLASDGYASGSAFQRGVFAAGPGPWGSPSGYMNDDLAFRTYVAVNQASTGLAVDPASGTYGGTTTLTATLTVGGAPLSGQTVTFALNGQPFSGNTAVTDSSGVATLSNVSLAGINAGTYPIAIGASFAGDTNYLSSSGTGTLTVNQASTGLAVDPASGTYGGTTTLTATLTAGGVGVANQTVTFTLNGISVGSATTDGSGVVTLQNVSLAGINAGTYPGYVRASFDGTGTNYASSSGTGTLTISSVLTASQQANALIQEVNALVVPLSPGQAHVLKSVLTWLLTLTTNKSVNIVKVNGFIASVTVLERTGILTQAQANPLIQGADSLLVTLRLG